MTKTCAICLASGSGSRMGGNTPKVLIPVGNHPALYHSLIAFEKSSIIDGIVLVCPKEDITMYRNIVKDWQINKLTKVVSGGATRGHSVENGLNTISDCDYVLIHDGARPMLIGSGLKIVFNETKKHGAAIAARPIVNTIKKADGTKIIDTVSRDDLWEVYTPQGFKFNLIKQAYSFAHSNNIPVTDDAGAVEALGHEVYLADVLYRDFKLTTPEDILLVDKLLMKNKEIRVGLGFDVHKFAENRKLFLGGIEIPYELGLAGHSDADVLTHAIMDGILGAAHLPDIGELFPDTSANFKNIYSITLLKKVMEKVIELGFMVNNIDTVIACEQPKISPHKQAMEKCLAKAMRCDASLVNVKGTTTEKLGFEGREEGISARAIVTLRKI